MFLGSRVDDALSLYYQRILEHGERLDLAQVKDAYRELWSTELHAEEQKLGVDWQDIQQPTAFELGLQALELTFEQLVPKLGEPLAVQRRLEFTLAQGLVEWTIVCYLDLETRGPGPDRRADPPRRRLQGQGKPDQPAEGRPRPAGKPVPRRPLAGGPARRRVLVRADRQARTAAQTDERRARHHAANARAAALKPRPGRAGRVANRRLLPAFSGRSVRVRSVQLASRLRCRPRVWSEFACVVVVLVSRVGW